MYRVAAVPLASDRPRRLQLPEFVHRDAGADVLVVTNMWPEEQRPVYGIFVKRQVEALRAQGVRCDVLYLRGYVTPAAYPLAALRFLAASVSWRGRYRVVHGHAGETGLAARFFIGPPVLTTFHGDDILGDRTADGSIPVASRVRSAFVRGYANLFSATITQSQEMHERLPDRIRRRSTVLPCGIDIEHFRPIARDEARRHLGWGESDRVALFAATHPDIPRKRRWLAEAACAYASERLGPVRLHVSGTTPPDEMPLLMNAADCLLHTASLEGSPNVIREALVCNLPIVATPSGDIPDLLEGVEPSYLCRAEPAALGAALVACLGRAERTAESERASRSRRWRSQRAWSSSTTSSTRPRL